MHEPRAPGPVTIERAVAAWQRLQSAIRDDPQLEADETTITNTVDVDPQALPPEQLIGRLVEAMAWTEAGRITALEFARRLQARANRYRDRLDTMRDTLAALLEIFDRPRQTTPWGTASLANVPQRAKVTDISALPAGYVHEVLVRNPDLDALLADLLEGVVIPGAELSNARKTVRITRTKADAEESITNE